MPREPEDYRDNLELLNTMFPGMLMLGFPEVKAVTGWNDNRTIKKHLPMVGGRVSKVALAKMMSGGGVK